MADPSTSVLIIGESDVGKTHYGGQLLKRLMREDGEIRMDGAATNLQPFEDVIARLDAGLPAEHTAGAVYDESRWPVLDVTNGRKADLIWPDYAGEQIRNMTTDRRVPHAWLDRIAASTAWLLLIRLQKIRADDDVFSRPLPWVQQSAPQRQEDGLSDQARLVELMQILAYIRTTSAAQQPVPPRLVVLLTCWDEMESPRQPDDELRLRLPLLADFLTCHWDDALVLGLSSLGRALDKEEPDQEYIAQGSEQFGYVVLQDGNHSPDLTLPIRTLIADSA